MYFTYNIYSYLYLTTFMIIVITTIKSFVLESLTANNQEFSLEKIRKTMNILSEGTREHSHL